MVTLYWYSATYSLNITHMQHAMLYLVIVSHFQPSFNKQVPQVQIFTSNWLLIHIYTGYMYGLILV